MTGTPTSVSLGEFDPVTVLQLWMQLRGVTLTDEQAACWLESIGQIGRGLRRRPALAVSPERDGPRVTAGPFASSAA